MYFDKGRIFLRQSSTSHRVQRDFCNNLFSQIFPFREGYLYLQLVILVFHSQKLYKSFGISAEMRQVFQIFKMVCKDHTWITDTEQLLMTDSSLLGLPRTRDNKHLKIPADTSLHFQYFKHIVPRWQEQVLPLWMCSTWSLDIPCN